MKRDAIDVRGVAVETRALVKGYAGRRVLDGAGLSIAPGEFVSIVGRSGCGKSTLLRLLAGLERPDAGEILLDGHARAQHQSDIRIMFQEARLLPWKRVLDNVALGLSGPDALPRAREALAQVGLADRAHEWPAVLSGGARHRVGRSPAHWCTRHACCCSTSRSAPWTRSPASRCIG
jgi:sulfonate transport system ATP-binding protein